MLTVPVPSLVELADADAIKESLGLARREALWAIKALRDEPLELWSAAVEREARTVSETAGPCRPLGRGGVMRPTAGTGEKTIDIQSYVLPFIPSEAMPARTLHELFER
jgi:hypothetical protein